MDHRKTVITSLKSIHGVMTDTELMNNLQNMGIISDNCVTIDEVSDADLMRAYNRAIGNEEGE